MSEELPKCICGHEMADHYEDAEADYSWPCKECGCPDRRIEGHDYDTSSVCGGCGDTGVANHGSDFESPCSCTEEEEVKPECPHCGSEPGRTGPFGQQYKCGTVMPPKDPVKFRSETCVERTESARMPCSQCGAPWCGSNAEHEDVYECGRGNVFVSRGVCPRTKPPEPPTKEPGICRWCGQGLIVNIYEDERIVYEDYSESEQSLMEDGPHLTHARCLYCGAGSPDPRNLIGEFMVTDRNLELIANRVLTAMNDRSSYVTVPPRVAQALIEFWQEHHHVKE